MARFQAANMREWTERQKANAALIVRQSIQDVSAIAQTPKAKGGRMPVDTGMLRNSYTAGLNGAAAMTGPLAYEAVLGGFEMGDTFIGGWTVDYALRQEKGFVGEDSLGRNYNQPGNFFMESALQQWVSVNAANAARIKG